MMAANNTKQIVSLSDRFAVSPRQSISKYTKNSLANVTAAITPTTISVGTSNRINRFIYLVFYMVFCPNVPV